MSYRIEYGESKNDSNKSRFLSRLLMTGIFFILFLLSVSVFWSDGREVLQLLLIPDTTLDAAETFVSELDCGASLKTAASDFFHKLIRYETIY